MTNGLLPVHSPLDLIDPAQMTADRIKMLLYADFGEGKTSFAASAPNCLFISAEAGEAALLKPWYPLDPRTRIVRAFSMADLRQIKHAIDTNWQGFAEYDSYTLDSLSDIARLCLIEIMVREERKHPTRRKGQPYQADYQEVTNVIGRMVMDFRNLPKHVIFTASYRNDKNPATVGGYTGRSPIRAELTPALYKTVAGYVDIVAYLQRYPELGAGGQPTGRTHRYMQFVDDTMQFATKTRYRLPPFLVDPSFRDLMSAINGGSAK